MQDGFVRLGLNPLPKTDIRLLPAARNPPVRRPGSLSSTLLLICWDAWPEVLAQLGSVSSSTWHRRDRAPDPRSPDQSQRRRLKRGAGHQERKHQERQKYSHKECTKRERRAGEALTGSQDLKLLNRAGLKSRNIKRMPGLGSALQKP